MINCKEAPMYPSHQGCVSLLRILMCGAIRTTVQNNVGVVMGQLPNHTHACFTHVRLDRTLLKNLQDKFSNDSAYSAIANEDVIKGTLKHHLNIDLFIGSTRGMYLSDGHLIILIHLSNTGAGSEYLLVEIRTNIGKFPELPIWS